jgi:hypothetical protein
MVIAAVWKLFQVATDLGDIKKLLKEMRRETPIPAARPVEIAPVAYASAPLAATVPATVPVPPAAPPLPPVMAGPISLESAEALLREIEAESHALAAAEQAKTTA